MVTLAFKPVSAHHNFLLYYYPGHHLEEPVYEYAVFVQFSICGNQPMGCYIARTSVDDSIVTKQFW